MLREFEPLPADNRKSFYGKCSIYQNEAGARALRSYRTIVMTQDETGQLHRHWPGWSQTTARHIWAGFGIDTETYRSMQVEPLPAEWEELRYSIS